MEALQLDGFDFGSESIADHLCGLALDVVVADVVALGEVVWVEEDEFGEEYGAVAAVDACEGQRQLFPLNHM